MANLSERLPMDKPSVLSVVGERVSLRKAGQEYKGLCSFHEEKTPSFTINEDKGLFHCFGCGESGDVIAFVQKVEGVGFLEALSILGMRQDQIQRPRNDAIRRKAETVSQWANHCFDQAQSLLREIGQRERIAEELGWIDKIERCKREWDILSDLSDDLQDTTRVMELWTEREAVEAILADAPDETLPTFPTITPEYRARLQAAVRGEL